MRQAQRYDVICANLIFDLLLAQQHRLLSRLKPGGALVLAGILRSEFSKLRAAYERSGLRLTSFNASREWASAVFVGGCMVA